MPFWMGLTEIIFHQNPRRNLHCSIQITSMCVACVSLRINIHVISGKKWNFLFSLYFSILDNCAWHILNIFKDIFCKSQISDNFWESIKILLCKIVKIVVKIFDFLDNPCTFSVFCFTSQQKWIKMLSKKGYPSYFLKKGNPSKKWSGS